MNSVIQTRDALTQLLRDIEHVVGGQHPAPLPGSIAETDGLSMYKLDVEASWSCAQLLSEYTFEHLAAFLKTLHEPVEPLASLTCVRSMLEASSIWAWLIDPTVDLKKRLSRSLAFRYAGLVEQLKFGKYVGSPLSEIHKIEARMDKLESKALTAGLTRLVDKKGHRSGVAEHMPSATEIIRQVIDEEWMYRALSAVAHGHPWMLWQLGFQKVSTSKTGALLEKKPNDGMIALASLSIIRGLGKPLSNTWIYFGLERAELVEALNKCCDQLSVAPQKRCW